MADEKPDQQAPPAKKAGTGGTVLVKLHSSGKDDTFRVGHPDDPDNQFVVTTQGVEVAEGELEDLLEIAQYNGVTLSVGPVEKEGKQA